MRNRDLKWMVWIIMSLSLVFAQPKWSVSLGSGYYNPSLIGLDADTNTVLPNASTFNKNILLNWGFQYQFYPNARLGLSTFYSFHSGGIEKSDFSRLIRYRLLSLETFFFLRKRMELNFSLAPMWNKATISLKSSGSSDDWNLLLASYGIESKDLNSQGKMVKRWFGFTSMIGFKYYLYSWLSIDTKIGFMRNFYKAENWKVDGKKEKGPEMNIDKLPVYHLNFVFGW